MTIIYIKKNKMQSSEWQGYALKAAAGIVAVAVIGYAAYQLAKEDELETV